MEDSARIGDLMPGNAPRCPRIARSAPEAAIPHDWRPEPPQEAGLAALAQSVGLCKRTPAQARLEIVREALSWIGTPYHHAAGIKGVGADCVWLLIRVFQSCGLLETNFDAGDYPRDWHLHRSQELYLAGIKANCLPAAEPWGVGDILTYRFGRCVSHGGIYIGAGKIVHALAGREVEVADIANPLLATRFAGGWRLKWL